jgi:hypothetical protein
MAWLLGAALAPGLEFGAASARADVSITISNQGSQLQGGTAVPVVFTDLTVRLNDGTILRPVVPGDANNTTIYSGRQVGQPGGPAVITVPGIDAADIALVTPSRRVGSGQNARDVPSGGILRPSVAQMISIPELDAPNGNLLAIIIDSSIPHNLPAAGTVLTFTGGLNPAVPDWFIPASFDESTMTYTGAYSGTGTVEEPVIGVEVASVPESSTLVLMIGAALGLMGYCRPWGAARSRCRAVCRGDRPN